MPAGKLARLTVLGEEPAQACSGARILIRTEIDQPADVASRQQFAAAAEDAFGFRIEALDAAAFVEREDADERRGEYGLLPRKRFPQRNSGVFALLNFASQLGGFAPHQLGHVFEGARQEPDLAAGISRHDHPFVAAECLHRSGHLLERARERPRQRRRQHNGSEHGDDRTHDGVEHAEGARGHEHQRHHGDGHAGG